MILIDYSQVSITYITAKIKDSPDMTLQDSRRAVLNAIRKINHQFRHKWGRDIVIACDGTSNWRKTYFKYYKGHRDAARASSTIDWTKVHDHMRQIRDELKEHMPYQVVWIDEAEGDDVIAVLAQANSQNGVKSLIVSSDKDFAQLHNDITHQYSHKTKEVVQRSFPREILKEHIIRGDRDDGVPNILSNDDCLIAKISQSPITQNRLQNLMEQDLSLTEHSRNWERNRVLIDFQCIPNYIREGILAEYGSQRQKPFKTAFAYLSKMGLKDLLAQSDQF